MELQNDDRDHDAENLWNLYEVGSDAELVHGARSTREDVGVYMNLFYIYTSSCNFSPCFG